MPKLCEQCGKQSPSFHESDSSSIQAVPDVGERGATSQCRSAEQVVRMAGRCRTVFTGSYHAAVFALAQGTPVVAIAASPYYFQNATDQEVRDATPPCRQRSWRASMHRARYSDETRHELTSPKVSLA